MKGSNILDSHVTAVELFASEREHKNTVGTWRGSEDRKFIGH